jgi:hypothetical protein
LNVLEFSENVSKNELKIQFKGNQNNKMYVENINLKSKLQCQRQVSSKNVGNSDLTVKIFCQIILD